MRVEEEHIRRINYGTESAVACSNKDRGFEIRYCRVACCIIFVLRSGTIYSKGKRTLERDLEQGNQSDIAASYTRTLLHLQIQRGWAVDVHAILGIDVSLFR